MSLKSIPALLTCISTLLLLTGCITGGAVVEQATPGIQAQAELERALIRSAVMHIEVEDAVATADRVGELTREIGGYVASSSVIGEERVSFSLRIPNETLDEALDSFASLGKVKRRSISSEDVTAHLIDAQARLENLIVTRDRLREHLQVATDVSGIIEVERELARVQTEIDSLEGRLAHLRSSVALSTVDLEISRKQILGPLGFITWAIGTGISKLFVIR